MSLLRKKYRLVALTCVLSPLVFVCCFVILYGLGTSLPISIFFSVFSTVVFLAYCLSKYRKLPDGGSSLHHHYAAPEVVAVIHTQERTALTISYSMKVDFPGECEVRRPLTLSVQFDARPEDDLIEEQRLRSHHTVSVAAHLSGSTFSFDRRWTDVSLGTDRAKISFNVIPRKCGERTIAIEVFHDAKRVGHREIVTRVLDDHTKIQTPSKAKEVVYEDDIANLELADSSSMKEKRRLVHVSRNTDTPEILDFVVYSGRNADESICASKKIGTEEDVLGSLQTYLNTLDEMLLSNPPDRSVSADWLENLIGIGRDLFNRILPDDIGAEICSWEENCMVGISTEESWIPWELLHDETDFLCRRFVLYRLPRRPDGFDDDSIADNIDAQTMERIESVVNKVMKDGMASVDSAELVPISDRLSEILRSRMEDPKSADSRGSESKYAGNRVLTVRRILNIIGGNLSDKSTMRLEHMFEFVENQCSIRNLKADGLAELVQMSQGADIFHFTCHGKHPRGLLPYLQISRQSPDSLDRNLLLSSVRMLSVKKGCLVFLNTCRSETAQLLFKKFVNFGWKFYEMGCTLCIGTLTSIPQDGAIRFSEEFYTNSLARKLPINQALAEAREQLINEGRYFPLFYCVYGDPALSLTV